MSDSTISSSAATGVVATGGGATGAGAGGASALGLEPFGRGSNASAPRRGRSVGLAPELVLIVLGRRAGSTTARPAGRGPTGESALPK
jgi:hypothetical protein